MPKIIDIAKLLSNTINSNEFSAALSASDPLSVDISEEEFEKIKQQTSGLLTLESAANNPELLKAVRPKLLPEIEAEEMARKKKSIYDSVEEKISGVGEKLGLDLKGKRIDDQLDLLAKHKNSGGNNEELVQRYNALQQEHATFKETAEKEKQKLINDHAQYQVDSKIMSKLQASNLATPYKEDMIKNQIFKGVLSEVKSKASISLNEDGSFKLNDKNNPEVELFEGTKKLGINDIIDPIMQPYLAKNDGGKPTPKTEQPLDSPGQSNAAQGSAQESFRISKQEGATV